MNNDLIGIIAAYTTTFNTFRLFSYYPQIAYRPRFWIQKASVESRGLIVSESVIGTNWYPYYLIRNETYFGNQLTVDITAQGDVREVIETGTILGINYTELGAQVQLNDLSVRIPLKHGNPRIIPFRRRITNWQRDLAIGEDGILYRIDARKVSCVFSAEWVIDTRVYYQSELMVLTRDGTVFILHIGTDPGTWTVTPLTGPKVIGLISRQHSISANGELLYLEADGYYGSIDRAPPEKRKFRLGSPLTPRYLNYSIQADLTNPDRESKQKVVAVTGRAIIGLDRSIYAYNYTDRKYHLIPESLGRAQYVTSAYTCLWAIIDPKSD